MALPSADAAQRFIDGASFLWHQTWSIVPGVRTPGANDIDWLWHTAGLPADLTGRSLLDIGTTNGATSFLAEQRGASRVLALDVCEPDLHGFASIAALLGSSVEWRRGSVYELPDVLDGETFDFVVFWGVLYHLRHPLLALDQVRSAVREDGEVYVETAVADATLPADVASQSVAAYYRTDELAGDTTNWFAPTTRALEEWCASSGMEPVRSERWPEGAPTRAHVACRVVPGTPEWDRISYEVPVRASLQL